jgi:hypothetical protein
LVDWGDRFSERCAVLATPGTDPPGGVGDHGALAARAIVIGVPDRGGPRVVDVETSSGQQLLRSAFYVAVIC